MTPCILLVEDEQVNRDLFRRRLERKNYSVVPAESGLQAVALTQSEKPDLVLMDLGLPDIDGWEATRRIKADPATAAIPVVVLSAHATTDGRDKAFAAGCEEFETKPVNWEAPFKKIEEVLAREGKSGGQPGAAGAPDPGETALDFAVGDSGAYSLYNWEVFYHAPMFIASLLLQNHQFRTP